MLLWNLHKKNNGLQGCNNQTTKTTYHYHTKKVMQAFTENIIPKRNMMLVQSFHRKKKYELKSMNYGR